MINNRRLILAFWLSIWGLVACGGNEPPPISASATPSPTATTVSLDLGYQGPMLQNAAPIGIGSSQSGCSADSGCLMDEPTPPADMDDAPLALTSQQVGAFEVGIPTGYSPLELRDEILITAVSSETLGNFTVSLRLLDEAALQDHLVRFDGADFSEGTPVETSYLQGHWLPTEDYGAIGLFKTIATVDLDQPLSEQFVFIESFSDATYWRYFEATFFAMLDSVRLVD